MTQLSHAHTPETLYKTAIRSSKASGRVIRAFEPLNPVYAKCENGVIVVALIPAEAYVIGSPGGECCASKALIMRLLGDKPDRELVGVSPYARGVTFRVGDYVDFTENFDFAKNSFHFFVTLDEAKEA